MKTSEKKKSLIINGAVNRVNFTHQVLPIVREAIEAATYLYTEHEIEKPRLHCLSEDRKIHEQTAKNPTWGDSITLNFGCIAIGIPPTVNVKGNCRRMSEVQAKLVLSQTVSGDIFALIYPPYSEVLSSADNHYVVEHFARADAITVKAILKLIELTLTVNSFTGTLVYPNAKGARLMAKLESKQSAILSGGSAAWRYIRYLISFGKGIGKLHGIGVPGK